MGKVSVTRKLFIAFLVVSFITLFVGIIGIYGLYQNKKIQDEIIVLNNIMNSMQEARIAHLTFRANVGVFQRNENLTVINVEKDFHKCGFGKWYYGEGRRIVEEKIPEVSQLLKNIEEPHTKLHQSVEKLEDILKRGKEYRSDAVNFYESEVLSNLERVLLTLTEISTVANEEKLKQERNSIYVSNSISTLITIIIIIGVSISVFLGFALSLSIIKPLKIITSSLFESTNKLENNSYQMSTTGQQLSSTTSETAASIEEITASIEELQAIFETNAKNISQAEGLSKDAMINANEATQMMEKLKNALNEINENGNKILKINKVIDDIAFQTNILALNAAVESARAGEAGKGFAVVSEQVKSLAQRSSEASKETAILIEKAVESVNIGQKIGDHVFETITKNSNFNQKIASVMREIHSAIGEQLNGMNQITKAISQINVTVQNTASNSEESAKLGEELHLEADSINTRIKELNKMMLGDTKELSVEPSRKTVQKRLLKS